MGKKAMNQFRNIFLLVLSLFLTACTVPGTYMSVGEMEQASVVHGKLVQAKIIPISRASLSQSRPYNYRVGPYDTLSIIVWDHPELSSPASPSNSTATATMPGGSTLAPSMQTAQVSTQGTGIQVNTSGYIYFPYAGNVKVSGLTVNQIRNVLRRKLSKYIRKPQISVNIIGYQHNQIYVMGEVVRPGTETLTNKPLTLMDAINGSGGINPTTADAHHVYVLRGNSIRFVVYWLNISSPQAMIQAERFYLRPKDIVYVAPAGIANWNRVVAQILPTVQSLWYTKSLVDA